MLLRRSLATRLVRVGLTRHLRVSEERRDMLEGIENTIYGNDAAAAGRLRTVGNALSIAAAVEGILTVASGKEFGYLTYLRADCSVVGTTAGTWALRNAIGGAIMLLLQMPIPAAVVGTSYCWPFPVPWKTGQVGDQFTLQPSVATMGTWVFICNGFLSSI